MTLCSYELADISGRSPLKFSELELHPSLLGAIEKLGYDETTPVQAATMPHLLEGRDVAGLAQTGTGKTAAFLLPMMERILRAANPVENLTPEQSERYGKRAFPDWKNGQFILVLVPTRELCDQVYENALKLKGDSAIRAVSIYGGVAYEKQKQGLRDGVEFIIATPGRLLDLYKEHLVDLKQVRAIIFDEADRMFDMGFKDDMKYILQRVPKERQFLVFSATLNMDVMSTAYQYGANPVDVDVSRDQAKAENVVDKIFHVSVEEKAQYLLTLIKKHEPRQAIIFSNFKMNVPRVAQFLNDNKVKAVGISSLLTQQQRTRVIEQFKADNDSNILVATDVAARGLDIKGVDMVINYELPDDAENYVHRIGRTGRAGEKGKAFSLVSDRDVEAMQRIEDYLKHKVDIDWMDDADFVKDFKPMQSDRGDRGPRRDSGGDRGPRSGGGPRSEGRGPRREGGSRDAGGRDSGRDGGRGRDRGPRRDGPRDGDRDQQRASGPRPEGQPGSRPGPRVEGGARPPREGGKEGGRGRDRNRGPRPEGARTEGGRPRGDRPANQGGPRGEQRHASGSRVQRNDKGGRPGQPGSRPGSRPGAPPSKGIGQKVSGFFKKLFGQ